MSTLNKQTEHHCERCPNKGIICCEGCNVRNSMSCFNKS